MTKPVYSHFYEFTRNTYALILYGQVMEFHSSSKPQEELCEKCYARAYCLVHETGVDNLCAHLRKLGRGKNGWFKHVPVDFPPLTDKFPKTCGRLPCCSN